MKDIEKSDLKSGMVFEIANGKRYLVVSDKTAIRERGNLSLDGYEEDLTRKGGNVEYDIKKVFGVQDGYYCQVDMLSNASNLIWEEDCYV